MPQKDPTQQFILNSGLLALTSASVQAGIIHVTAPGNAYIEVQSGSTYYSWDVDGDTVSDFHLGTRQEGNLIVTTFAGLYWGTGANASTQNAFVVRDISTNQLINVSTGKIISADVNKVLASSYTFTHLYAPRTFVGEWANNNGIALLGDGEVSTSVNFLPNFMATPEQPLSQTIYAGFRFNYNGDEFYYGWATLLINKKHSDVRDEPGIQILEWAYNDTAGEGITVGAIPEPETVASGLGILALGAAGLRCWRNRRKP